MPKSRSQDDSGGHPFGAADSDRYERRDLLGKGGMGRVVRVLDRRLRREVALKEVGHPGPDHQQANDRLAREAWITAQLEHPSIVAVHDAGQSEDGSLFYIMRLIRGRSLEELFRDADTVEERIGLLRPFLDACQAVAYAHSLGIVHRDLKPANIMVGEFGETQVVDWGLARPSDSDVGERWVEEVLHQVNLTQAVDGVVTGTPGYMSPEQASGQPADERSDVWGLGAVLHELITGRPPFSGRDTKEVLTKLRTLPVPAIEPDSAVSPELVAIAERALRRDPEQRYSDAQSLAADVVCFFDGSHVRAYDYTPLDHLWRFVAARRKLLMVIGVAFVSIVGVSVVAAVQTANERDRAQRAERDVREALVESDSHLMRALVQQARVAARAGARPEAELLAAHALVMGGSPEARGILAGFDLARPRRVQADPVPRCRQRILSADTLRLLCVKDHSVSLWTDVPFREKWSKPMEAHRAVFLESTGEVALFNNNTSSMVFLNTDTGSLISEKRTRSNVVMGIQFSPNGAKIIDYVESRTMERSSGERRDISLCADAGGTSVGVHTRDSTYAVICRENALAVGDLHEASRSTPLDLPSSFHSMRNRATLLESGRWVLLSTVKSAMVLIDLKSRQIVRSFETNVGHLRDFVVSPNNRVLAVAGTRGGVRLMDLSTGAWLGRLPAQGSINQLRFVDDHQLLVLGDRLERWMLPTGLHSMEFNNEGGFSGVDFSPDSTLLAVSTATGQLRVWSLGSDAPVRLDDQMGALASMQWSATPGVAKDVSFTPDGKTLIGGAMDAPGVGMFSTEDWHDQGALLPGAGTAGHPFFRRVGALAGGWVFGLSFNQTGPEVWRLGDPETDDFFRVPGLTFFDAATNHGGTAAVMNDSTGKVFRMTTVPSPSMTPVPVAFEVASVDISSDGERVAVARPGRIEIVEVATGETKFRLVDLEGLVLDVALSADDRYLAASFMNGVVRVWGVDTGVLVAVFRGHTERVAAIEFSPNGRWLASASWDGTLRLWGLTVLERPAAELLSEVETAWELTLKQALATDYR